MNLLVLDRQDNSVRVLTMDKLMALARNPQIVSRALKRFQEGFCAIVPSPPCHTYVKGWKIVEVLKCL